MTDAQPGVQFKHHNDNITPNNGNKTMRHFTTNVTNTRVRLNGVSMYEIWRVVRTTDGSTCLQQCNRKNRTEAMELWGSWMDDENTIECGCVDNDRNGTRVS